MRPPIRLCRRTGGRSRLSGAAAARSWSDPWCASKEASSVRHARENRNPTMAPSVGQLRKGVQLALTGVCIMSDVQALRHSRRRAGAVVDQRPGRRSWAGSATALNASIRRFPSGCMATRCGSGLGLTICRRLTNPAGRGQPHQSKGGRSVAAEAGHRVSVACENPGGLQATRRPIHRAHRQCDAQRPRSLPGGRS